LIRVTIKAINRSSDGVGALIGVRNKYVPETFFCFEQMICPLPRRKLKPANWPAKVADALKRPIVYENGEP
jgi:hypothetical protein